MQSRSESRAELHEELRIPFAQESFPAHRMDTAETAPLPMEEWRWQTKITATTSRYALLAD